MRDNKNEDVIALGPVHSTLEEFENGGFTLKTHQMISVHTTPEKFREIMIIASRSYVFKMFSVDTKTKRRCFQKPAVCFRKAPFS